MAGRSARKRSRNVSQEKLMNFSKKAFSLFAYLAVTLLLTAVMVHFFKAGSGKKGIDQIVLMSKFYSSPEEFKDLVFNSFQDHEAELNMLLDSTYSDKTRRDSLQQIVHRIFGQNLDSKSKRIVTLIVERQDMELMEKIKYAEEELQHEIFTSREKELFREKFAEISKLFLILNNESNNNKLAACMHVVRMESFNPMYHYSAIRSIIEFAFNYVDPGNIGTFTQQLLIDRAYSDDHELKSWELKGFNLLQAEEVDSSFHVLGGFIDDINSDIDVEDKKAAKFDLISTFIKELNAGNYSVFKKEYPDVVKNVLVENLEWVFEEYANSAQDAHQMLEAFEFLVEIGHFDIDYFRKHSNYFNEFAYVLSDVQPLEKRFKMAYELKDYLQTLSIDIHDVNRKEYIEIMDMIIFYSE